MRTQLTHRQSTPCRLSRTGKQTLIGVPLPLTGAAASETPRLYVAVVSIKGDWEWMLKTCRLRRHYTANRICWLCLPDPWIVGQCVCKWLSLDAVLVNLVRALRAIDSRLRFLRQTVAQTARIWT